MAILLFGADFFVSVAWHEMSRRLFFAFSWQCIRSRNASHLCAKPFGTYRNVWSWNGFDDIKQHATERRNRFDQAVTASGATMQAGPDSLRRPRRPARRGRIPLSENALAQTGAGTATVVLLTAIMALIDVGVYDICRVDSGLPKRFGRKLSDAALIVACRNASVWRMIHRVVSMAWNHGMCAAARAESFIGIVHMDGGIMKGWPGEPDMGT